MKPGDRRRLDGVVHVLRDAQPVHIKAVGRDRIWWTLCHPRRYWEMDKVGEATTDAVTCLACVMRG